MTMDADERLLLLDCAPLPKGDALLIMADARDVADRLVRLGYVELWEIDLHGKTFGVVIATDAGRDALLNDE